MIRRTALAILFAAACLAGAFAAANKPHYVNVRYGYAIDLPEGFSAVREADNGDGGISHSADRKSALSLWGANLLLESFPSEVGTRIRDAQEEGWQVGYTKIKGKSASWSGSRDGRIFYARAILLCHDDQAGFFQLEYPEDAKDALDPVVRQLVRDFKATSCD